MTNHYIPDKWIIIEISSAEDSVRKVFATWSGGYLDGDSWRLSSGITKVEDKGDWYLFHNESGSIYQCYKNQYGTNSYSYGVLQDMMERVPDSVNITIVEEYNNE
jgi:hypothetical protein